MKKPTDKLPPWVCRNPRDRRKMIVWVNNELDRILHEEFIEGQRQAVVSFNKERHFAWLEAFGPEIEQAEHGNIEPLRRRLPSLAKFLHLPKRGRGKRFSKLKRPDPVDAAIGDLKRIRALWKRNYGKKNRRPDDGPSAEQIAADRWEVEVENVVQRMKKSPMK